MIPSNTDATAHPFLAELVSALDPGLMAAMGGAAPPTPRARERLVAHDAAFTAAAAQTGIPAALLRRIAVVESGGDPLAESGSAFGLMQLTVPAWRDVQKRVAAVRGRRFASCWREPALNVLFGAHAFRLKAERLALWAGAPVPGWLVHAAYNGGERTLRLAAESAPDLAASLRPEFLVPAIARTGVTGYYIRGAGRRLNPWHSSRLAWRRRRAAAIELKYAEVILYLARMAAAE